MPIDPQFAESWLNKSREVLGRKLRPFCLWHRFLFEVTNSPILLGAPVSFLELYAAVEICTLPFGEFLGGEWMADPAKQKAIRRGEKDFDLGSEAAKMAAHIADYFAPPALWHKDGGKSHDDPPPEILSLAAHVISVTGWEEERVWMLPIGKVYWYSAVFARLAGAETRFVSESSGDLESILRMKAEYQAAKLKGDK